MSKNRMPEGRWEAVINRDQHCQAGAYRFGSEHECSGWPVVHHRRPRGMGGTPNPGIHDMDNLVMLCDLHHIEVHAYPGRAYKCGLLIRR